ncbi:MAG: C40 family peptidase [bacterium]|nr:C40 family peptidase [bacterium]
MHRPGILALSFALALSWACGSAPTAVPPGRAGGVTPSVPPRGPASSLPSTEDPVARRVVRLARSLLATPYRYAGSDTRGFDCSGLTSYVFARVGLSLPRTAQSQASAGRWVAPDELASGDLVFFGDDRTKPYHVGLVVSEPGEPLAMIHSSSSLGVTETTVLSNSYWLPRLRFGRRVLEGD